MDHKQQIYPEGSGEAEIIRTLGLRRANLTLLDAFRCCPYIVHVAAEFMEDAREREAFLNQSRTLQTEIQTPMLYEANDFEDERARLIEVLRGRQLVDRSIAVLFTSNRLVQGFARGLREAGIPVETRKEGPDFTNGVPKVLPFFSAKGLTFDSVLMPRLVPASFSPWPDGWAKRLLYVGITRATRWVYFSTIRGQPIPELDQMRRLAATKPPVVSLFTAERPRRGAGSAVPSGESDDLLYIL